MPIQLTPEVMRGLFPRAPQGVLDAFVAKQHVLDEAGITTTRTRLAYFFANIEHECGGFTIPNLTESIAYTHQRAAEIFPARAGHTAAEVRAKYGDQPGWQKAMFDDVYGNRMGNRPNSHDGSTYIGRGGPQWTGRDGYEQCEKRTGIPAVEHPGDVSNYGNQPEVCAAFWTWKKLNAKADAGDFKGCVKLWNGGTIGMADREQRLEGNDPYIQRLLNVDKAMPVVKQAPGGPPTKDPPPEVIAEATKTERAARAGGVASTAGGVGTKAINETSTVVPDKPPFMSPVITYTLVGVGIAVVVITVILIARKQRLIKENWF